MRKIYGRGKDETENRRATKEPAAENTTTIASNQRQICAPTPKLKSPTTLSFTTNCASFEQAPFRDRLLLFPPPRRSGGHVCPLSRLPRLLRQVPVLPGAEDGVLLQLEWNIK